MLARGTFFIQSRFREGRDIGGGQMLGEGRHWGRGKGWQGGHMLGGSLMLEGESDVGGETQMWEGGSEESHIWGWGGQMLGVKSDVGKRL